MNFFKTNIIGNSRDKAYPVPTNHLIFLSLLIAMFISACTGLGGEPEIVATVPVTPSTTEVIEEEPLFPQSVPDIENGALIFAGNCTDCHVCVTQC